jgi:nitrogen fixation protein FixH
MDEQVLTDDAGVIKRYLATGKHWPIMLVLLFVSQASIVIWTAVIASGPASRPHEDGYYAKSLNWDNEHALLRRAEELGWSIETDVGMSSGAPPQRLVTVHLNDREGQAIDEAVIELVGYHRARSDQQTELVLAPVEGGGYARSMVMRKDGLWEFQIRIRAHGEQLQVSRIIEVGG